MAFNLFKSLSSPNLVSETYEYCINFLENSRCKSLPFHSVEHTNEICTYTKYIVRYEGVYGSHLAPIVIGALFHDTGMAETDADHEEHSVEYARDYLKEKNYAEKKIKIGTNCIL